MTDNPAHCPCYPPQSISTLLVGIPLPGPNLISQKQLPLHANKKVHPLPPLKAQLSPLRNVTTCNFAHTTHSAQLAALQMFCLRVASKEGFCHACQNH